MNQPDSTYLGESPLAPPPGPVSGRLLEFQGERCYVVENVQEMKPFLMSLVSDSDHWLFLASSGALTAGRRNPAMALFPYVTEDRVMDSVGVSGPVTSLRARVRGRRQLWRPLRGDDRLVQRVVRRLYRNLLGNRLVLEEENLDLGLTFRAGWTTSDGYGFVRECELVNGNAEPVEVEILDGLLNVLPAEIDDALENALSVLVDAYKRSERVPGTRLATFALQARVSDRPEPREALRATTVWSHGIEDGRVLLEADAVARFDRGSPLEEQEDRCGGRGAYLVSGRTALPPGGAERWLVVADVHRTQHQVAALAVELAEPARAVERVRQDVARGRERLLRIVAGTDALQRTEDELATAHHVANVLFNDMRGGVPAGGGAVSSKDLAGFVARMSPGTAARQRDFLASLPERAPRQELLERVERQGDPDLSRLALEYLPITFSRRHGDPSRPWNRFDIRVRDEQGEERIAYQGNWRDIFQNWEALALSWPDLVEGFIARFVNASTADGHNPYRISSDGLDWEIPEPHNPWSGIGYWGDHQLVYLQRLVDLSRAQHPGRLRALLRRAIFTYADVPYRIAPFDDVVKNPRSTIAFDAEKHRRIGARIEAEGGDARLLGGPGGLHRVTLAEKLVVPALAKLANLVPGGGVWMNTQRPEWNDANNALVGFGLSVVTLCQLGSYLRMLQEVLAGLGEGPVPVTREVADWLRATRSALDGQRALLDREPTDADRGAFLEAVGRPASAFREALYARGLSAPVEVPARELGELAGLGLLYARHSLARNRRADGLYHSYNLLAPRADGRSFGVEHLPEMLEGQAAALGSGLVEPDEALVVLAALRRSALYRPDQQSYILYPERRLPGFLERSVVPEEELRASPALQRVLAAGDRVLRRDAGGRVRFRETLDGADRCREALEALRAEGALDAAAVAEALEAYERVFHHRQFTGRSGTMYAYEGLGCVYWHMVGKLLVAVQERCFAAAEAGAPAGVVQGLARAYHEIRTGMAGTRKTPEQYGAIPLDPYSHTPRRGGARQPGMTGQVKEEVLARMGELGVRVRDGRLRFWPLLLRASELLVRPSSLEVIGVGGARETLALDAGTLAFTLCQVPVVYRRSGAPGVTVTGPGGSTRRLDGDTLDEATTAEVLGRTGQVRRIEVELVQLYEQ